MRLSWLWLAGAVFPGLLAAQTGRGNYARIALLRPLDGRTVDFEAELPRHPTGKLYKRLLRDRYWQGRESKIV